MAETVMGIIQAETFLFRERGFKDRLSYDAYWNTIVHIIDTWYDLALVLGEINK